ncbi:hypothetical protein DY000_02033802 [Brassica cretica]|uniref:CCHC-type domain-containing protein n=1 Tax=Brassica cretica TaxID=69181 RepID=A0ABQ7DYG6_BRACR|nr:hypothetical protein DY000_02033802 [Brassica cretica]
MLNNGTNQLDHLLSIGQIDRCGLGYQGECLKSEGVFVPACKTKDVATSDTKPEVKRCFKLLKEKNQMEQAYGMRCHGPVCYSCGVQGHIRRDYFRSVQGANHGGFGLKNTWSRRFDQYGDGGI